VQNFVFDIHCAYHLAENVSCLVEEGFYLQVGVHGFELFHVFEGCDQPLNFATSGRGVIFF